MSSRTQNISRSNEEIVDLFFSGNGDFRLGSNGDLDDTTGYEHRALVQAVMKRLSSTKLDWPMQPTIGANFGDFLGQENSKENAMRIKSRIVSELTRGGLVSGQNLQVQIVPYSKTGILILVFIRTADSSQPIFIQLSYDMRDNKMIPRNL